MFNSEYLVIILNMFTLFNRRRRRRTHNQNNIMISNTRSHSGGKRATSLPPTRMQRQNGISHINSNNTNGGIENASGDFCRHSQPRTINLLYGELPWHVSHSDVYGVSTGVQQDFPEVQKMPLFGSVPALHQMNSMQVDVNNNNNVISNGKPEDVPINTKQDKNRPNENENTSENYVSNLRYFNLRQPVNLAGPVDPKVILHESRPDEEGQSNHVKCVESSMVIQPLSLMPDWR